MTFKVNPGAEAWIARLSDEVRDSVLDEIAADARRFAPVDTGELVGSIHVDHSAGEVAASADHAGYVELGTRFMSAQPYLAPALYRKRQLHSKEA